MKAKTASPVNQKDSETAMWQAGPEHTPTFTARQRLHQNVQRLQSLDEQLLADQLQQPELLTAIELVGFKIRHLARQIQNAEQIGAGAAC
jgi:hypothetical protein